MRLQWPSFHDVQLSKGHPARLMSDVQGFVPILVANFVKSFAAILIGSQTL